MKLLEDRATRKAAAGLLAAVMMAAGLSGCSSGAPDATCDEWASGTDDERDEHQEQLFEAHDLDKYTVGNNVGLYAALLDFCGDPISGEASHNGSRQIDDAVDWEAVESAGQWP